LCAPLQVQVSSAAGAAAPDSGTKAPAAGDQPPFTLREQAAAIKIQAAQKGWQARKRVSAMRQAKAADAGGTTTHATEAAEPVAAADPAPESGAETMGDSAPAAAGLAGDHQTQKAPASKYTAEQQEAAVIRIQAAHRGWQARKRVGTLREATAAASGAEEQRAARKEAAAIRIQAANRGWRARKRVQSIRKERDAAAVAADTSSQPRQEAAGSDDGRSQQPPSRLVPLLPLAGPTAVREQPSAAAAAAAAAAPPPLKLPGSSPGEVAGDSVQQGSDSTAGHSTQSSTANKALRHR